LVKKEEVYIYITRLIVESKVGCLDAIRCTTHWWDPLLQRYSTACLCQTSPVKQQIRRLGDNSILRKLTDSMVIEAVPLITQRILAVCCITFTCTHLAECIKCTAAMNVSLIEDILQW